MRTLTLLRRNLTYYWRTNLAVVLGVAIAVSVLAGAALVGESVRASLRDLFLNRLGATDSVVVGSGFFRETLADSFPAACPLIAMEGLVIHDRAGSRASHVSVYGIDERFWKFHGRSGKAPESREILLSPALAEEIGAGAGDSVVVRMRKPSAIPAEWLHGRKDDAGRAMRFTVRQILPPEELGEFSLRAQQGAVRAAFVPLRGLQKDLDLPGKANAILLSSGGGDQVLKGAFTLADLGLKIRKLGDRDAISIESEGALIGDAVVASAKLTASNLLFEAAPVFTYLANTIRNDDREIPYSLVTAGSVPGLPSLSGDQIALNEWAARDLGAKAGDTITLEYYVWKEEGRLATESAPFSLAAIVPLKGATADRDLAPEYPGMTDSESLHDWDPPFPVDLRRVRPIDEDYWKTYRTTPKAFIALERGQQLWGSRFGKMTSIRLTPPSGMDLQLAHELFEKRWREKIDPLRSGLAVLPVRAQGLAAAQGSTDFGEYFAYFSFFLVISALVLTGLFFRLGIEQRLREIGALRALGFSAGKIGALFLTEGALLALAGSLIGVAGAAGYGALALLGLRTFWVDAVGTKSLALHVSAESLALGASAGMLTAVISIALSVRKLRAISPLRLLSGGARDIMEPRARRSYVVTARLLWLVAIALLAAAAANKIGQTAGFFGAGALLLSALLLYEWNWLAGERRGLPRSIPRQGFRNAGYRPGRSILCIILVGLATFLVVAVGAFRRPQEPFSGDRKAGDGGYPLLAESILPLYYDLNTAAGQENLNLTALGKQATIVRFRLRPGDDVSCLNLYQPRNPRILAPTPDFMRAGRFAFASSLAPRESNPWLLLESDPKDGAIPAVVDANTLEYTLHLKLGDVFTAGDVRLRVVGALQDSVFQSEFLISEPNFVRAFPGQEGYRFFLVDTTRENAAKVSQLLEQSLSDYGLDVAPTSDRLASFHRVENTYLSTFQTLGSLGLILGTAGLAAVMLRNILERRRELALLQAMGYRTADLAVMVMAENLFLLGSGLAIGTACALLAIAPAFAARGGQFPAVSLLLLLLGVLLSGLISSLVAMQAVTRVPLLPALRAE